LTCCLVLGCIKFSYPIFCLFELCMLLFCSLLHSGYTRQHDRILLLIGSIALMWCAMCYINLKYDLLITLFNSLSSFYLPLLFYPLPLPMKFECQCFLERPQPQVLLRQVLEGRYGWEISRLIMEVQSTHKYIGKGLLGFGL